MYIHFWNIKYFLMQINQILIHRHGFFAYTVRGYCTQEQRAAEQAIRDAAKAEAVEGYKTLSELDLEIVVDVRSFTITHPAELEE